MNNTIQPGYAPWASGLMQGLGAAKQAGVQGAGFLGLAARVKAPSPAEAQETAATGAVSLEDMLKAKYPGLVYHVFDASSGYWRTRTDYPHYLLYQKGDQAAETLADWQPTGANPFYGSIDGKFTAPKEIHALGSVPPGSKAVVIHPKVQARMEEDPAYAQEIMARIDAWFAFDVARNEAILPGHTAGMSQAVAIGEDGNICNAVSSSGGGGFTFSTSGPEDDRPSWWELRMARHAGFMKLLVESQIADSIQASQELSALAMQAAAKSQLADMMNGGQLQAALGSEIAGIPTETVLAITKAQVWG